ncbi:hypothetical protein [uncultured Actinomyces sp.]|uniref:hypothetical protein n=1 Tax=uncultured Actinomyces sp. TaxID=249061 RepID=UPI00260BCF92|nr:hypothetical protein [uncultured Actinomyces sp.]
MNSGELQFVKAIYSVAKKCYNDSIEPLHSCERPGEREDKDWFKVKYYAEALIELAKENDNG